MPATQYLSIPATRLYIKKCSHCDLKYFGKSVSEEIESYSGSGKHWTRHLKKHNAKAVHVWSSDWYLDEKIVEDATRFSTQNNIVEDKGWANLVIETGKDGGDTSQSENWKRAKADGKLARPGELNGMYGKRGPLNPKFGILRPGTGKSGKDNSIPLGSKRSEEVKKKISETVKKTTSCEVWRKKHSEKAKSRCTDEWKARVAENNKRQLCCITCGRQMGISSLGSHRRGSKCLPRAAL